MKKWILIGLMALAIATLTACDEATITADDGVRATRIATPRTEGEHRLGDYDVVLIDSREALEAYIEATTWFGFAERTPENSIDFASFIDDFDEAYFEAFIVVLVVMEEFSQSVQHQLTSIEVANGHATLQVDRVIPPVYVEALGSWHLVVELDRDEYDISEAEVMMTTYEETEHRGDFLAIRTQYASDEDTTRLHVIDTYEALRAFVEANEGTYNYGVGYGGSSFLEAIARYDETYFETGKIAIVIVTEPSGSNRHAFHGAYFKDGTLELHFERIIPHIGTADMATWHLVVELDKEDHAADEITYRFTKTILDDAS